MRVQGEMPADLGGGHFAPSAEDFGQAEVQKGLQKPGLGAAGQQGVVTVVAVPRRTGRRGSRVHK